MNIKSVAPNILNLDTIKRPDGTRGVRSEASQNDRDPNGQRDPNAEDQKRKLTDEEMEKALEHLRSLEGVKQNNLIVRMSSEKDLRVVYIEDAAGTVVRRIPESELWPLIRDQGRPTGQIFDKAM